MSHSAGLRSRAQAFTLIELLIVIAIIAILSAIAIPNFLEAQTRAKVARAMADMRSLATGIESYFVDYNAYPRGRPEGADKPNYVPLSRRMVTLTTPVAYITRIPPDVFPATGWNGEGGTTQFTMEEKDLDAYDYYDAASDMEEDQRNPDSTRHSMWRLASAGPDLWASFGIIRDNPPLPDRSGLDYDPTNGTVSWGDIVRVGPPL